MDVLSDLIIDGDISANNVSGDNTGDKTLFYSDRNSFPVQGNLNLIYVDKSTNKLYVWTITGYKPIVGGADMYKETYDSDNDGVVDKAFADKGGNQIDTTYEKTSNKKTTLSVVSDTTYPTTKAVKDELDQLTQAQDAAFKVFLFNNFM